MRDHLSTATSTRTAHAVRSSAVPTPETQAKRRSLFIGLLGAVLLSAVVVSLLPNAQAKETVVASAPDEAAPIVESPTTATQAPTTVTTEAPSTTAAAKPSTTSTAQRKPTTTTTTKPKPTTTTTAPKPAPRAAAAPVTAAPAPSGSGATPAEAAFLACIRKRESGGNYSVVSSNGLWFGAYQMTRQTWDSTAQRAGRPDLVGVPPNQASPADQDHLALVLYRWLGKSPWGGAC
jgi:outer membrane biosynthesis protein TonB